MWCVCDSKQGSDGKLKPLWSRERGKMGYCWAILTPCGVCRNSEIMHMYIWVCQDLFDQNQIYTELHLKSHFFYWIFQIVCYTKSIRLISCEFTSNIKYTVAMREKRQTQWYFAQTGLLYLSLKYQIYLHMCTHRSGEHSHILNSANHLSTGHTACKGLWESVVPCRLITLLLNSSHTLFY